MSCLVGIWHVNQDDCDWKNLILEASPDVKKKAKVLMISHFWVLSLEECDLDSDLVDGS